MLDKNVLTELGNVKKLFIALLAPVHHSDALKELIEVESSGIVLSFCTLQLAKYINFFLGQLIDATATQFTLQRVKVVF